MPAAQEWHDARMAPQPMCLSCSPALLITTNAHVHAALLFRLKQKAMAECRAAAQAYADCCSGRIFSAVWSCRGELRELNQCLRQQCALPMQHVCRMVMQWHAIFPNRVLLCASLQHK